MFQVSRWSITLVLCLGKLKLVRDTASYVVNTPPKKLAVGTIGKKKCLPTPPYPQKSTRIYSLGWAGIKLILSLLEAFQKYLKGSF